ncbi:MAG: flagellar filament capping protein FliD [Bryobacteraceae bacterium]
MGDTTSVFNGTSRYAEDFQSLIDRSVAIASLQKDQLEDNLTEMESEATALDSLDSVFTSLQSAIESLKSAVEEQANSLSNSSGSVVSASITSDASEGVYSVEVVDLGSYTSAMSKDGLTTVTDPSTENVSTSSTYTLTVDGVAYDLTTAGSTLSALADAINTATDACVDATIVNVGTTSSPDYRLSLQSTKLGAVSIQLNDGTNELVDTMSTGTLATYTVNGSSTISSDSREVTISSGLTAELLKAGSATLTVTNNAGEISSALSSFADAYNTASEKLQSHRGENSGALSGESTVYTLSQMLRDIAGYSTGTDGISSLMSLGLTFEKDGTLTFDSSVFNEAAEEDLESVLSFLGASGDGFVDSASAGIESIEDSDNGVLKVAINSLETTISRQEEKISEEEEYLEDLELRLENQMASADALIAQLEQEYDVILSLFEAMSEDDE